MVVREFISFWSFPIEPELFEFIIFLLIIHWEYVAVLNIIQIVK